MNPALPLEIFLPPDDFNDKYFLGTEDFNGLNTGIFFIRVHEWSVKLLANTISYPMFYPDTDLGNNDDQRAMEILFDKPEYKQHVVYQPKTWYNAYLSEIKPGDLLVHFPGLLSHARVTNMKSWLSVVKGPEGKEKYEQELHDTRYPKEIEEFWAQIRQNQSIQSSTVRSRFG